MSARRLSPAVPKCWYITGLHTVDVRVSNAWYLGFAFHSQGPFFILATLTS